MSFRYGDNWADEVESEELYLPRRASVSTPPPPPPTNHGTKRYVQSVQSKDAPKSTSAPQRKSPQPQRASQPTTQTQTVKAAGTTQVRSGAGGYHVGAQQQTVQTRQRHGTLWDPHLKREEIVITRQQLGTKIASATPAAPPAAHPPTTAANTSAGNTSALEARIRLLESTVTKQNMLLENMHKKNKKLKRFQEQTEACVKEMRGAMGYLMKRQLNAAHGGGAVLPIDPDNKILRVLVSESMRSPTTTHTLGMAHNNHNANNPHTMMVSPRTPFSGSSRLNPNATPFLPDNASDATRTESAFSTGDGDYTAGDLSDEEKEFSTI